MIESGSGLARSQSLTPERNFSDQEGPCILDDTAPLRSVRCIQATTAAFAAVRADGRVVAWGSGSTGGDCSALVGSSRDCSSLITSNMTQA